MKSLLLALSCATVAYGSNGSNKRRCSYGDQSGRPTKSVKTSSSGRPEKRVKYSWDEIEVSGADNEDANGLYHAYDNDNKLNPPTFFDKVFAPLGVSWKTEAHPDDGIVYYTKDGNHNHIIFMTRRTTEWHFYSYNPETEERRRYFSFRPYPKYPDGTPRPTNPETMPPQGGWREETGKYSDIKITGEGYDSSR